MAAARRPEDMWQIDKSLVECTNHILQHSSIYSDVTFKLNSRQGERGGKAVYIRAVQALLVIRSPVFYSMFTGGLAAQTEQPPVIDIPDIEPEAFKELLRYIYTDTVQLTTSNVMGVLYAAKKYMVTKLSKECVTFLEENLSADSAARLLEQSILFEEESLKTRVLDKIREDAPAVLASDDFQKISSEALREVLQHDLKINSELLVFEATMKWAERKCRELQKQVSGPNKREALRENLFLVRFPTMSVDDLNESVIPSNVLQPMEIIQLFQYITAKSNRSTNLPFPTEPRNNPGRRYPKGGPKSASPSPQHPCANRHQRMTNQLQSTSDTTRVLQLTNVFFYRGCFQADQSFSTECKITIKYGKIIRIKKIAVNIPQLPRGWVRYVKVTLANGETVLYSHETIQDEDHTLDVQIGHWGDSVCVALNITVSVSGPDGQHGDTYLPFYYGEGRLVDNYVGVNCPVEKINFLRGIEYSVVK